MKNSAAKRIKCILSILVLLILHFNGCATFFADDKSEIYLSSEPQQARILLNGNEVGKTPLKITLKKERENIIEFIKEGYKKETLNMYYSPGTNWLILNSFNMIGLIIDALTMKWNEFDINTYKAQLIPLQQQEPETP